MLKVNDRVEVVELFHLGAASPRVGVTIGSIGTVKGIDPLHHFPYLVKLDNGTVENFEYAELSLLRVAPDGDSQS